MAGASVRLSGTVVASPRADQQAIELHVTSEDGVKVLGACPGESYEGIAPFVNSNAFVNTACLHANTRFE